MADISGIPDRLRLLCMTIHTIQFPDYYGPTKTLTDVRDSIAVIADEIEQSVKEGRDADADK